jgi:hypothetical protein
MIGVGQLKNSKRNLLKPLVIETGLHNLKADYNKIELE